MKLMTNTLKITLLAGALFAFAACETTKKEKDTFLIVTDQQILPPVLTKVPVIEYSGIGIKYECESMYLKNCVVMQDNSASGRFSIRIVDDASSAQMKVKFPAGTYEVLLNEKAKDKNHCAFYLYLDGIASRVYPGTEPSGDWELTTRSPVYFKIDEPRTVTVTIMPNSDHAVGSTGMNLDYIQFVKR
ncbi:MAG: hypothetical protein KBS64_00490 [Treponema sp.]|nr:hypothetical protein [Candidatus Treponema equi]